MAAAAAGAGTATTAAAAAPVEAGTAMAAVAAGAAATGPGLEMPARGGEDCLTLGLKLCPPSVFTMAGLEKEKRWRGWEEERFQK